MSNCRIVDGRDLLMFVVVRRRSYTTGGSGCSSTTHRLEGLHGPYIRPFGLGYHTKLMFINDYVYIYFISGPWRASTTGTPARTSSSVPRVERSSRAHDYDITAERVGKNRRRENSYPSVARGQRFLKAFRSIATQYYLRVRVGIPTASCINICIYVLNNMI